MKKKPTFAASRALKFEGPRLYLHDIRQVCDEANSRDLDARFGDDRYEYDSIDEVKAEKGEAIRNLNIWFTDPKNQESLRIELSLGTWEVRCGKGDTLAGLQSTVISVLNERRPWFARMPSFWPTLGVTLVAWTIAEAISNNWPVLSSGIRFFGLFFLLFSATCNLAKSFHGRLILKREHEEQSWYERNGEKLLYGVIGAIFGHGSKLLIDFFSAR